MWIGGDLRGQAALGAFAIVVDLGSSPRRLPMSEPRFRMRGVALRRALPSRAAIDLPPPPMARSGTRQLSPLCMADAAFDRPMVLRADRPCYVAQREHAALRCRAQTEPTQHATPAFRQIAIAPPPHSSAPASPPGRRDGALAGWARVSGCGAARPSRCCMREAALVVPRCRRPHVPPSRCTPVAPNVVRKPLIQFEFQHIGVIFESTDLTLPLDGTTTMLGGPERPPSTAGGRVPLAVFLRAGWPLQPWS